MAQQIRFTNLEDQTQVSTNRIKSFAQDQNGFLWIASIDNLWRFDGYQLKSFNAEIEALTGVVPTDITELVAGANNQLWISTSFNGLFLYTPEMTTHFNPTDQIKNITDNRISSMLLDEDDLWLGANLGLLKVDKSLQFSFFPLQSPVLSIKSKITDVLKVSSDTLLVSTQHHLFKFSTDTQAFTLIPTNLAETTYIKLLWTDDDGQVMLGTNTGLFLFENNQITAKFAKTIKSSITGILKHDGEYWISSIGDGLWKIDTATNQISQFEVNPANPTSLNENTITTLYKDQAGLMWLGGFTGSVDFFDISNLKFGLHDVNSVDSKCLSKDSIYQILLASSHSTFLLNNKDLILFNHQTNDCRLIDLKLDTNNKTERIVPLDIINGENSWWILSNFGLHKMNLDFTLSTFIPLDFITAYFVDEIEPGQFTIGTNSGLLTFNLSTNQTVKPKATTEQIATSTYYSFIIVSQANDVKTTIYNTRNGLVYLNENGELDYFGALSKKYPQLDTISILNNTRGGFWVGSYKNGFFALDDQGQILQHFASINGHSDFSVYSMISDDMGQLWLGTDIGLIEFNPDEMTAVIYDHNDGLQGDFFNINSVAKSPIGFLYFGGRNGLNVFNPAAITANNRLKKPAITGISRFNKSVNFYQADNPLNLDKPIDLLEELVLDYQDYVISLEFSALNISHASNIQYAYQLVGFDPDWNYVSSNQRTATYTNLPSGSYTFKLKTALQNNNTESKVKSLEIKVLPPPWLTWWAIISYILIALGAIYWYVQHKIKSNQKIAQMLRIEVAEKTKELNTQKQTVESLLDKKNELFSNVSHEFRTPLTLILGPIKSLLDKQVDSADIKSLNMINRNANRLLSLVEQLLQIARVSDLTQVKTTPQNTEVQVSSLVESFQYMASSKNIQLTLSHNEQATIDVTDQFIDAVLGNLVSNAIKYTPSGGQVSVSATTNDKSLSLVVKDTGPGLSAAQQKDIFKRFKRLDSHQAIEGIGIGLSVVEELVKVNHGEIQVNSTVDEGSEFIITVPLAEAIETTQELAISSLVTQLQRASFEAAVPVVTDAVKSETEDSSLNTVLVIEDNHDMREHILEIVRPHYNVLAAENGVKGVAKAIEQVPDIIISDVMMPEMDGFDVARIIRADQRTSHIPLMLLTALNDKTSRIKGWRENVDAYMTKPFDRDELLVQLENMLTIRDILKKKAGQSITEPSSEQSVLPKRDQEFVDQLMQVIEDNYQNPLLNRTKIASAMAVSDRQLQRKLKAMIDQNPMDVLREFRLNKAKESLKEGYQVSIISDECGFNSLSYFSQCFKAKFGLSPKQYQQK